MNGALVWRGTADGRWDLHKFGIIWHISDAEEKRSKELGLHCEAPNCDRWPDYVLLVDREPPIVVYACSEHAKAWAEDSGLPVPDSEQTPPVDG